MVWMLALSAGAMWPGRAVSTPALLQSDALSYVGAFRLPQGPFGTSFGFAYAGSGLAYNPEHRSLFINGHTTEQRTAEISIPAPVRSRDLNQLPTAGVLQPFADLTDGHLGEIGAVGAAARHPMIGGLLVFGSRLVGTAYEYYDVSGFARLSHFTSGRTLAAVGDFKGMFAVGSLDPGYLAGYMTAIPPAWQAALGGPALTGMCCLPGAYRTSLGPGAFVFNPDDLGVRTPAPATPLVYYSTAHPTLGTWEGNGMANPAYNMGSTITGVVFPRGTSSVLFFGRTGLGAACYGPGTADAALVGKPSGDGVDPWCHDPDNASKGTHAYPYAAYVWAYDANELAVVKSGRRQPWDVRPYATWQLPSLAGFEITGAAYDGDTDRIFVTEAYGDGVRPLVHVYAVRPAQTGAAGRD